MEIVIAILFSTVISLGVGLYFRMLGKKDDPLERINKFANKKTNELNEAFNKIQTRFNTIISDFNAQQTQANAAVKLLKQQNEDFNSKMQTFDQSINAVKNIKAQIDGYAKILNELNDMTAQVEENLERLHKESGVITSLDGKLSKQQQQIALIEKRIPEVSKEFSVKNAEQLKAVGSTLLENYESRASQLAAEIKTSQGEAEKALDEIKQSIQEAYNQAAASAEKLENTAFTHLSEQAQQRTDQYLKELGEQTAALQNELEKGRPVIVVIRSFVDKSYLHFATVTGYDEEKVYIADSIQSWVNVDKDGNAIEPALETAPTSDESVYYNRTIPVEEFKKLWNTSMLKMPLYRNMFFVMK